MKTRILVVDDSNLARRSLRQILESWGHQVEDAANGAQAIERYFIQRPDVVLLDMVMEGMYGLDVLAKFKELDPSARVIVATADIQTSTKDDARKAGAMGLINKPVDREELSKVLGAVLEGKSTWN
jgi:two-component system, chemotaxis family, chemotaxis protein CheY